MKKLTTLILTLFILIGLYGQDNRIPVLRSDGSKVDIFMSGGNLAWDQFANDFGPGATNFDYFEEVFTAFEDAGGNTMRLWVHINGANNPNLDGNGYTTGLEESHLSDMQRVLDLAYNHKIVLVLSLWSFDMLNNRDYPAEVSAQGELILTVEENIQAYIDNALIPMVEEFSDHPAVGSWEIFNEPEGMSNEFGWSHTNHVPMSVIQRFVNRCAGAIHRTDSDALVTNGTWSMYAMSDVYTNNATYKNYYSDEELIAAGGDADGTLDFYQVHYYDWMSEDNSIMHHPASYWGLDKAIVIGEFFPLDAAGISWSTYYDYLYNNGYAGALTWQWAGEDGSTEPYRTNMVALMESIRDYADIEIEPDRNRYPFISSIDNGLFDINAGTVTNYVDLDDIASDPDGDALSFSIQSNSNTALVDVSINASNGIDLAFTADMSGEATIVIQAQDPEGLTAIVEFGIVVRESGTGNLALFRTTVYTLHNEEGTSTADPLYATDGDYNTRWSSAYQDPAWYYIDLGSVYEVNQVILYWEVAYGQRYEIQVSNDASSWTTVYTENGSDGGTDDISFDPVETQYVRMYGIQRATEWGYSLYEFEVYGTGGGPAPIPLEGISVNPTAVSLNPIQSYQIDVEYTPSNATNLSVTWASNNEAVATVSDQGLIIAQSLGEATITATSEDGGYTASCTVNVTDGPNNTCTSYTPIALPFTNDGAGNYCWETSGTIEYINSWNLDYLTINSVDITNGWTNSFPAKIDGKYYISYGSSVGWAHIEIDGTSDPVGETFTLSVSQPTGGSISPTGGDYEAGTVVTITATADEGYLFNQWTGDATGTSNPVTVTMDDNKSVSATFNQTLIYYDLAVTVEGQGSTDLTPGSYLEGTSLSYSASAASGWLLSDIIINGVSYGPTLPIINMDSDKDVIVVFTEESVTYHSISLTITGSGTVEQSPEGTSFPAGTEITLTAIAAEGWIFTGWNGDISLDPSTVTITLDSDMSVTAVFEEDDPDTYTLSVSISGNGTVDPLGGTYTSGTPVTLTATADADNHFVSWSGDASGTTSPITITMDSDKSVTATFAPDGGGGCDNPVTITLPYSQNGEGEYCWFTTDDIAYVNSWNMATVEINNVDFTNNWASNMPDKIDGGYYIYYDGLYAWSHFEATSTKSAPESIVTQVYPNPFTESTTILLNSPELVQSIELYDHTGRLVEVVDQSEINSEINIGSNLKAGLYLLNVRKDSGVKVYSIVKY